MFAGTSEFAVLVHVFWKTRCVDKNTLVYLKDTIGRWPICHIPKKGTESLGVQTRAQWYSYDRTVNLLLPWVKISVLTPQSVPRLIIFFNRVRKTTTFGHFSWNWPTYKIKSEPSCACVKHIGKVFQRHNTWEVGNCDTIARWYINCRQLFHYSRFLPFITVLLICLNVFITSPLHFNIGGYHPRMMIELCSAPEGNTVFEMHHPNRRSSFI